MENLKHIKWDLENFVYKKLEANEETDFKYLDTCELGQVVDMIKDLSEAIYYCTVTDAMEHGSKATLYTQTPPTTVPNA